MDVERARDPVAAKPPRRLRLDELLRELGADDAKPSTDALERSGPEPGPLGSMTRGRSGPDAGPLGSMTRGRSGPDAGPLGSMPPGRVRADGVTLGELVDKAAEGGFGFVIGVLALLAIPFFGLSMPFGLAIALLGAQLALGKQRPWLPKRVRARRLSMAMLDRILRMLGKRMRWLARMTTRRRYEAMITPRWIGLGIMLLALGLALPLPIPGSNMIFIIPILIYSIALLERDGVWSALGHLCTAIDMTLLVVFGATVIAILQRVWNWVT